MRKLLVVLNYYQPYISGVSEHARIVAEALSADYAVTVLTGRHEPALAAEELVNGVRVIRAPLLARLHKGYLSPSFFHAFYCLSRQADLVHFQLPMIEAGPLSLLVPRERLFVTYHCDTAFGKGLLDAAAVRAVRLSARLACTRARQIVPTSADYARGSPVIGSMMHKCTAIHPPIDPGPRFLPAPQSEFFEIGFVGRFVEEKGLPVLLAAFELLQHDIPQARLHLAGERHAIAGGGIYRALAAQLQRLGSRVVVHGCLPRAELWRLYRQLDVLVLPSVNEYEAFGMVQLEAMSCGALVVASDLRGVRVPVQRTGSGVLAPAGDAPALAAAIRSCVEQRRQLSREEVMQKTADMFSTAETIKRYREVFAAAVR